MKYDVSLSLRLPSEDAAWLARMSERLPMPASSIMRVALREFRKNCEAARGEPAAVLSSIEKE